MRLLQQFIKTDGGPSSSIGKGREAHDYECYRCMSSLQRKEKLQDAIGIFVGCVRPSQKADSICGGGMKYPWSAILVVASALLMIGWCCWEAQKVEKDQRRKKRP